MEQHLTVRLIMDNRANRKLLGEELGKQYQVVADESQEQSRPQTILTEQYDLLIMDNYSSAGLLQKIAERKQSEAPVFLPFLFIYPVQGLKGQGERLMRVFDGIIYPPIRKLDLLNRVQVLTRARTMSLALLESNRKLAETNEELKKAMAEIHTLKGILPICSYCKKIRDDKGYWKQLEVYIQDHSEAEFSHGICKECMVKYYPEYADEEG